MAKSFEQRVKIESIGSVEEIGTNGFRKREVVGVIEGEYPEYLKFEFIQNKVDVPEDFLEGTYATIHFNLRGRKVERDGGVMYFTSLQAWKMEA